MLSLKYWRIWILVPCVTALYVFFIWGIWLNPPGFYLDESGGAYNAYLIAKTGRGEFGHWFPLFPQFYTESFVQYSNPVHIYLMALMYLVVPPSNVSARVCMATMMFIAVVILGMLAKRISGRTSIGIIVTLTAATTPWLFEPSRLVLECAVYPLAISLLLFFLYNAIQRERWKLSDSILIGLSLGMATYTYTIGRLLGPLLAIGLVLFVRNTKTLFSVVRTWAVYAITLIPFMVVYFGGDTVTRRFNSVTWVDLSQPWSVFFSNLWDAYSQDAGPTFLLDQGDPLLRHHIPGTGEILAATFALAMVGLIVVLFRHWRERWWWYIVYGLLIAVLPGALTVQRFHALRTIAVPVFLLVLTVPAMMWLVGKAKERIRSYESFADWLDDLPARFIDGVMEWRRIIFNRHLLGAIILGVILLLTLDQAYTFQTRFREIGPTRGGVFDEAYLQVFDQAVALESWPIYLEDGFWGPAYVHALWYATIKGIDTSKFVHLAERQAAPADALVISSNNSCSSCEVVARAGGYLLYRASQTEGMVELIASQPNVSATPAEVKDNIPAPVIVPLQASKPRGIAVDGTGNIYVADTGNSRVLKLSSAGDVLAVIAQEGNPVLAQPTGVAIDAAGDLYVTDAGKKSVFKFRSNGTYVREWGPFPDFDDLRDVAIGADKYLYLTDRGRGGHVIRLNTDTGNKSEWGSAGSGDAQFSNLNGVAVSAESVYVADAQNDRVQVFDLNGTYLRQWSVPAWSNYLWHRPDMAVDEKANVVYVTSGWSHEVLVYDLQGSFVRSLKTEQPASFNNPSSIFFSDTKRGKFLYVLNTGADVVDTGPPSIFVFDLTEAKK